MTDVEAIELLDAEIAKVQAKITDNEDKEAQLLALFNEYRNKTSARIPIFNQVNVESILIEPLGSGSL